VANPKCRDGQLVGVDWRRLVIARIPANYFTGWIKNFNRHWAHSIRLQVVMNHRAEWRIFSQCLIARLRCAIVAAGRNVEGLSWFEQKYIEIRNGTADLTQSGNIIEHPETSAMCCQYQIVTMNNEIAHRCRRQIQLQGLPVIAVIERN